MPPAADSNRAASLENTEREGEEREEGVGGRLRGRDICIPIADSRWAGHGAEI